MIKITALDGLVVRGGSLEGALRIHAPKWYRLDRHLKWWLTPAKKRAITSIRFLGDEGKVVSRDVRAIAEW